MIVSKGTDILNIEGLAATIGFFDGVHLGHRFLIDELKRIAADRGLPSAVITFPTHPRTVLQPGFHPNLLNTPEEKIALLESTGIDYCILLDFSPELSQLSAHDFITLILRDRFSVKTLLTGYDHRFGHNRSDSFEDYVDYGNECGIEVVKASPFDSGDITVSSSGIREKLMSGEVGKAAGLLSYNYSLTGHIVNGYKVGRKLGFPTANILVDNPDKIIPAIGIYAVWVHLGEETYMGMLYIGDRPTLQNGNEITMEVNILDFDRDIYNNQITVSFVEYIRGDRRFDTLDELKVQLAEDREAVYKLLSDTK